MSGSRGQSGAVVLKKLFADTFASFATKRVKLGQVVTLKGHTVLNVGGGNFIGVASGTPDTGSCSATATAGIFVVRQNPKKNPYEFGFLDGGVDVSVAANACATVYGEVNLDGGKTYNQQYQINTRKIFGVGNGPAILNLTSPTANGRFGGPVSGTQNMTAVYFAGAVGNPLIGAECQNIIINCNSLILSTGTVGVKGFVFFRCKNFYQRNCIVNNCASYAYWDNDTSGTGTTYCSGVRDDCWAVDAQVSFEQVNVRGITLNNCHGYISSAVLSYAVEAIFHSYGGIDMQVAYNNCTGVADGICPAIFLGLLECQNVTFSDCQLINNYNNGASIQAAVYLDASGSSNFNNINFKNCLLKSEYTNAVGLTVGSTANVDNSFSFTDCEIYGYGVAVQLNGTGGRYYFSECETKARATLAVTPFCYYGNGVPADVQISGGVAKASTTGSGTPTATNLSYGIFNGTVLVPNTRQQPKVKQRSVGRAVISGDGSTYANLNVTLGGAVSGWTSVTVGTQKVTAVLTIDYGQSGAANLPAAVAMCYPYVYAMVANDICRFVLPQAAQGKTAVYEVTEWE